MRFFAKFQCSIRSDYILVSKKVIGKGLHLLHGTVVVISPLISLMKDQVDGARETGIKAAYLNSSLEYEESAAVIRQLRQHQLEMLYIAPERFSIDSFFNLLKDVPVSLFAVDEAQCISEWGHDFRPDYLNLHAGLDQGERKRYQDAFNNDEIQVIVATIAFGMGIDKTILYYKNPYPVRSFPVFPVIINRR